MLWDINDLIITIGSDFQIPEIDKDEPGLEPESMKGDIEFRNVSFAYPMRPDIVVGI